MNSTMAVVALLFTLSLFGAVTLFKFLKSTALIKNKTYQAGGALAGFLLLFVILSNFYTKMENAAGQKENAAGQKENAALQKENADLREKLKEKILFGRVTPPTDDTLVLVCAYEAQADILGEYRISVPSVDLGRDNVKLHIVRGDKRVPKLVHPGEFRYDVHLESQ